MKDEYEEENESVQQTANSNTLDTDFRTRLKSLGIASKSRLDIQMSITKDEWFEAFQLLDLNVEDQEILFRYFSDTARDGSEYVNVRSFQKIVPPTEDPETLAKIMRSVLSKARYEKFLQSQYYFLIFPCKQIFFD